MKLRDLKSIINKPELKDYLDVDITIDSNNKYQHPKALGVCFWTNKDGGKYVKMRVENFFENRAFSLIAVSGFTLRDDGKFIKIKENGKFIKVKGKNE
jgi:hypothetical protein